MPPECGDAVHPLVSMSRRALWIGSSIDEIRHMGEQCERRGRSRRGLRSHGNTLTVNLAGSPVLLQAQPPWPLCEETGLR